MLKQPNCYSQGTLKMGSLVNLERGLQTGARNSGHYVQVYNELLTLPHGHMRLLTARSR